MELFLRFVSTFSAIFIISLLICLVRGIFDQMADGTPFWKRSKFYCFGMMWCAIHATIALCMFSLTLLAGYIAGDIPEFLSVIIFLPYYIIMGLFAFSTAIIWVMSHFCVIADMRDVNDIWEHI